MKFYQHRLHFQLPTKAWKATAETSNLQVSAACRKARTRGYISLRPWPATQQDQDRNHQDGNTREYQKPSEIEHVRESRSPIHAL